MMKTVLFMCPHSAAKSVLAASYFNRAAEQRGLDVRAEFAGTEPDDAISPTVLAMLAREGFDAPANGPRLVTDADLAAASRIVTMGCDVTSIEAGRLDDWSDVPPVSVDAEVAARAIREHVDALVDDLERENKNAAR
jgi:protein-tyrosine-phosphatase